MPGSERRAGLKLEGTEAALTFSGLGSAAPAFSREGSDRWSRPLDPCAWIPVLSAEALK